MRADRLAAAMLAGVLCLTAAGCSEGQFGELMSEIAAEYTPPAATEALPEITPESAELYTADPAAVYASVSCRPQMFYGKYTVDGTHGVTLDKAEQQTFCKVISYCDYPVADRPLTALPYRIEAGPHSNVLALNYLSGYNWMTLQLLDEGGDRFPVRAAYSVRDDVLELRILKSYRYDADTSSLTYEFSDMTVEYGYRFDGERLTLTCGDESVTLRAEDLAKDAVNLYDCNLSSGSEAVCGITKLNLTPEDPHIIADGEQLVPEQYEFTPEGLFRLQWTQGDAHHAVQLVYYYADDDGLVLADGQNTYYYTQRSWDLYTKEVSTNLNIKGAKRLENMSDAEVEALLAKVGQLYKDLETELTKSGISAAINQETGEIALDSVLLFDVDAFSVTPEGQQMLDKFLAAYTSVIFSEKYDGFVEAIEIEGHSDPTGDITYNRTLSGYRADAVMQYCLSGQTGLDDAVTEKLAGMLTAQGYSSDRPVYCPDGTVDLNASRRVSFRFKIAVD